MMLGEVTPGGVGAGLYGMLVFAILAVFVAGLMVGRTPEYLGKKIQARRDEARRALPARRVPTVVLGFAGVVGRSSASRPSSILNPGAHGLSEVVYAYTSAANNNGSAFGGLTGNTDWFNTTLGLSMLVGRFVLIVARPRARRLARPQAGGAPSAGTFPTGTPTFTGLLVAVILVVVGLTYLPVARARADRGARCSCDEDTRVPLRLQRSSAPAALAAVRKLDPRHVARNPVMFLVEVGSVVVTVLFVKNLGLVHPGERLRGADRGLALDHRALRELRRGDGGGTRQGAGGHAPEDTRGDARPQAPRRRLDRRGAERAARRRRRSRRRGRRADPGRRRRRSRVSRPSTSPRSPASRRP